MSDVHVGSSFHKQSMKTDNYVKIFERINSSIGQSTVVQEFEEKRPKLSQFKPNKK